MKSIQIIKLSGYLLLLTGLLTITSCSKNESVNPTVSNISPAKASANTVLSVTGSGLGNIHSILFDKGNVVASFNPNFNTNEALIFRVPADAIPGEQNIVLTKSDGSQLKVSFNVLGFATITDVSEYNFVKGDKITLKGKNLDDVSKVALSRDTLTTVKVVSKTATTLTIEMPQTSLSESTLNITNSAGTTTTTQSFVAIDNAFKLFTDDYNPNYQDASWGPSGISTTVFKRGTASKFMQYNKGNWSQDGFGWTNTKNDNFKYFSFWIKGASQDYDLYIWSQQSPDGFSTFSDFNKITVPANVWTYFKIPVNNLKLWANGSEWNQIGWRIKGPDTQDETFYIDDVIFIK
jgi:hypothetical protein